MERISFSKRVRFYPEELDGDYVGRFRGMLIYIDGEVGDELINIKAYLNKPIGKRVVRHQLVAEVCMSTGSQGYTKNAYHVDLCQIDNRFQGHGLAPLLYRYLMRKLCISIQAGMTQSPGGRNIWATLAKMNDIVVFSTLTKRKTKKIYPIEIEKEDDELVHDDFEIYDGDREVYTFATAVHYSNGKKSNGTLYS
jgi:hypothetical protein